MGFIGVSHIEAIRLESEERPYPKCWYKPIFDDDDLASLAFRFTLSRDIDTAISPGDIRMFRLAHEIIENHRILALSQEERNVLRDRARKITDIIF